MNRCLKPGLIVASFVISGCAIFDTRGKAADDSLTRAYLESSSDVKDRAPASLAIPPQAKEGSNLDPVYMRTQADYHFTLAESYSLEGESQAAVEAYKLTLLYDAKSRQVRLRLASEYVKLGMVSEALEQAKLAVAEDTNDQEARLLLGGLYSALRMYQEARSEYELVLKLNPENTDAILFLGALSAEQKKYDDAIRYFQRLISQPAYKAPHIAHFYLGRIYLEKSQEADSLEKAEKSFQQALLLKPGFADGVIALGQLYEKSNRKADAIKVYRLYQENRRPDAAVAEALARLYVEQEKYEDAIAQLDIVADADPDDLNSRLKIAFILIEQKKYNEAIHRFEEILAREPGSDKVRYYMGAVFEEVKDFPSAIDHFEKIPASSTYYPEAITHIAYLYKLQGEYPKALEAARTGIKNRADHVPLYVLYASFLEDLKRYREAIDFLKETSKKFPQSAPVQYFLGSIYEKNKDSASAITSMQRVLEIDKDHVQALNFLAYLYAESNQSLAEAESMARRALGLQPNDGYILDTLGWVLYKKGRFSDAAKYLEAALHQQPEESIIAEHLGDVYVRLQMPEKAKKMYHRAANFEKNLDTQDKLRAKVADLERQVQNPTLGRRLPASDEKKETK